MQALPYLCDRNAGIPMVGKFNMVKVASGTRFFWQACPYAGAAIFNQVLRLNQEYIYMFNSPVGNHTYPTVAGANGSVYQINLELYY
jgi:hypothetical protein